MVFLTLVISSAVHGQTENLDQPYPDYPSIKESKKAFNRYFGNDYDSALLLAKEKYLFAYERNWSGGIASFGLMLSKAYGNIDQLDSSLYYLNISQEAAKDISVDKPDQIKWVKTIQANQNVSLAHILIRKGNYDSAIFQGKRALGYYSEIEDSVGISSAKNLLGAVSYYSGDVNEAAKYFSEGYQLQLLLGDTNNAVMTLGNLGSIYKAQGDLPKAMDAFMEQLQLGKEVKMK